MSPVARFLGTACITSRLFICLSWILVVRRDQRNQKKAYREDAFDRSGWRHAIKLGNLGEQIVLKSERAFKSIHFAGFERAPQALYGPLAKERDEAARAQYRELLAENPFEGVRIVDIVREGMTENDPRLQ